MICSLFSLARVYVTVCVGYCVKVRRMTVVEHYNSVSWNRTTESDTLFLLLRADAGTTLLKVVIFKDV